MSWEWLPPTILAGGTLVVATLGYRLQRRQNRDVDWTAQVLSGRRTDELVVKNCGIRKAQGVTVSVAPEPASDRWKKAPQDVDLGGYLKIDLGPRTLGRPPVDTVTVTWRKRFGRIGRWSSAI